jgi:hypothetical protein
MSSRLSSLPSSPGAEPKKAAMVIAGHNPMLEEESTLLRDIIGVGLILARGVASGTEKEDEEREDERMREREGSDDEGRPSLELSPPSPSTSCLPLYVPPHSLPPHSLASCVSAMRVPELPLLSELMVNRPSSRICLYCVLPPGW